MRHQQTQDDGRPGGSTTDPAAIPAEAAAAGHGHAAEEPTTAGRARDADEEEAPPFAEPAPQPTVFGAATVGGAVAAAAMAGRGRPEEHDVRDDDTVATGDGAVDDRLDVDRGRPTGFDQPGRGRHGSAARSAQTGQQSRDRHG